MKKLLSILLLFFPLAVSAEIRTQEPQRVTAVRSPSSIKIDGVLDEPVWQTQGYTNFLQSEPDDGAPASEKTVVWIAYDESGIYVAARMYDAQPEGIVSLLGRRDAEVDSDWFTFAVDPYFDRRSGFQFSINPAGAIIDGTLFNDEFKDMTWDGVWEYAAQVDEEGWTAEMHIPYDQLRFKKQDTYTWGVNFFRTIKRKNEKSAFSWIPKEESGYVSRFASLTGITHIQPRRLLEFLPYTMAQAQLQSHCSRGSLPHRDRLCRQSRIRHEVHAQDAPDAQLDCQSRLRAGRSRSGCDQHKRPGNLLC